MSNRHYLAIIAFLVILLLFQHGCRSNGSAKAPEIKVDTTVTIVQVPVVRVDTFNRPVPVAYIPSGYVDERKIIIPYPEEDTTEAELHDSAYLSYLYRIKDDYFAKVGYARTFSTAYGNITIDDTTQQNRLLPGKIKLDFKFPEKTTTITKTILEPKRVKVYATGSVLGSYVSPFQGVGWGAMVQFKNDNAIELQTIYRWDYNPTGIENQLYQLSYKHKISLR